MEIKGIVIVKIFESKDSTYKVLVVKTDSGKINVTGYFPQIDLGASYTFEGNLKLHAKYGETFVCTNYKESSFLNKEGIIHYLSGDKFVGIGEKTAQKIVDELGLDAISKIKKEPNILLNIKGFSKEKANNLVKELKENENVNNIFVTLYSYGLTKKASDKLYAKYNDNVIKKIEENPYILSYEVDGFGFKKCDQIALNVGFDLHSKIRISEALIFELNDLTYNLGNTFTLVRDLILKTINLLSVNETFDTYELEQALSILKDNQRVVIVNNRVYLKRLYDYETNSARMLLDLLNFKIKNASEKTIDKYILEEEANLDFKLTSEQKEAIKKSIKSKVSIITGGPGTGKTTILKVLLNVYGRIKNKSLVDLAYNDFVLLLAPTGRAAKRMTEQTQLPAHTIHKALEYNESNQFGRDAFNKLDSNLIIIDESSMIDIELFYHLLDAIPLKSQVIFVGDVDQLPSVGPGNVLSDLIDSSIFAVSRLNVIMRQKDTSNIIKLADQVNKKNIDFTIFNEKKEVFFYDLEISLVIPFILKLLAAYKKTSSDFNYDMQILCPMYSTDAGIDKINQAVQETFNNNLEYVKKGDKLFKKGDKVLQIQNNSELHVMNGDIGIIKEILKEKNESFLYIEFDSNLVKYPVSNLDELTLGYAISIHKSQGSEYKNVIIPIVSQFWIMLKKNLIYTAVTRAKEKVILLGSPNVFKKSLYQNETKRLTTLARLINPKLDILPNLEINENVDNKITIETKIQNIDEDKTDDKYIKIYDNLSAFDTILEDLNGITPFTCMEELK